MTSARRRGASRARAARARVRIRRGNSARRLSATASRVRPISRQASHVPTSTDAVRHRARQHRDAAAGRAEDEAVVEAVERPPARDGSLALGRDRRRFAGQMIRHVLAECPSAYSCHKSRRRRATRPVVAPGDTEATWALRFVSQGFEESIVHRQETGPRRVAHGPKLAALARVDGRDRDAGQPPAAPPDLHQHLGLDLVARCASAAAPAARRRERPGIRTGYRCSGTPTNHESTRLPSRLAW